MRKVKIGSVGVDSGQLMVCDPCYVGSEWKDDLFKDERAVKDTVTGKVFVLWKDFSSYEETLPGYPATINKLLSMGLFKNVDPTYAPPYTFSYDGACRATCSKERAGEMTFKKGHVGAGIAFSSGYGDGLYPVFAHYNEEGRIVRVTIEMG